MSLVLRSGEVLAGLMRGRTEIAAASSTRARTRRDPHPWTLVRMGAGDAGARRRDGHGGSAALRLRAGYERE